MAGFGFGHGFSRRQQFRAGPAIVAESVAAAGVTFLFAAPRPCGQYANGDWWVLGPVSITTMTPASTTQASGTDADGVAYANRVMHGTMVNPGNRVWAAGGLLANNTDNSKQGWDGLHRELLGAPTDKNIYESTFNRDPGVMGEPLVVTKGSVVKFVSNPTPPAQRRPVGLDMVVLTVVDAIPAADAIRPGVSRADKTSPCRLSEFNLDVFQNLAPTANAPTFEQALGWVDRYIEAGQVDFLNNYSHKGINNHPEYGRNVGNELHRALLCLHLKTFSSEQKLTLLSHMAAIADDFVARHEENGVTLGGVGETSSRSPLWPFAQLHWVPMPQLHGGLIFPTPKIFAGPRIARFSAWTVSTFLCPAQRQMVAHVVLTPTRCSVAQIGAKQRPIKSSAAALTGTPFTATLSLTPFTPARSRSS